MKQGQDHHLIFPPEFAKTARHTGHFDQINLATLIAWQISAHFLFMVQQIFVCSSKTLSFQDQIFQESRVVDINSNEEFFHECVR